MASLLDSVEINFVGVCHTCRHQHPIKGTQRTWLTFMADWEVKHRGHRVEFRSPERRVRRGLKDRLVYAVLDRFGLVPWTLAYAENADIKIAYGSSADFTITLASLATSSTLVAGREGTAVDNSSNKYLDALIGGKITTGTSPTDAKTIQVRVYGSWDDGPTYVDVLDGTDSAETFTSVDILHQVPTIATLGTNDTSDRAYYMSPKAASLVFGGAMPKFFGLFVSHDTGQNLNSTGGNHDLSYTPIYATAA